MQRFKSFVIEMPQINKDITKSVNARGINPVKTQLKKEKHENLGNGVFKHHISNGNHYYFNKNNDNIHDISIVNNKNEQIGVHKGSDGQHKIHDFMIKHAEDHGKISTSKINTPGSKHLWVSLVKSNPKNKTFHLIDKNTGTETKIDSNNIDSKSHHIWGIDNKFSNIALEMRHHHD